MRVDLFDFDLPEDRIALRPAEPARCRAPAGGAPGAPLWRTGTSATCRRCCGPATLLVFNDTRVIPARLKGVRDRGDGRVRGRGHPAPRARARTAGPPSCGPASGWRAGDRIALRRDATTAPACSARSTPRSPEKGEGGEVTLAFDLAGPDARRGHRRASALMPLPPYIAAKRAEDERDRTDYQTVYAARGRLGGRARPRACISRRSCWRALDARGRRAGTSSPCTSAPAPSCR